MNITHLKTVIHRFYSFNEARDWTMKDIKSHYETLCGYLNFQDMGQILETGCGTVSMTKGTGFPMQAYELGKSL